MSAATIDCRLTPETKRVGDYLLVPFDVPPGTRRLEVAYAYDGQQQPGSPNEIDLGLVDPRGGDFPAFPGFRGWSGNARTGAVVTERAATPGYLAGPLPPGGWWVLLGLYKVDPRGVDVRITIRPSPEEGELPFRPAAHALVRRRSTQQAEIWLAGDFHSHTYHSDAPGSLEDLVAEARRRGLAFLAVTDHNTTSHVPYLAAASADSLALIPGEEVTSYYGHMNVWGNTMPLDFRARERADISQIIDAAHDQGAIVSASHPTLTGQRWTFGYDLPLDCLEVWHGVAGELNKQTLAIWQDLLAAGRRITAIGGSDTHIGKPNSPMPGHPTTWLRTTSLDTHSVLEALRTGKATITAARDGPWLELESRKRFITARVDGGEAHRLRLITSRGELTTATVDRNPYTLELDVDFAEHRFVRAELILPAGSELAALTNPIWSE